MIHGSELAPCPPPICTEAQLLLKFFLHGRAGWAGCSWEAHAPSRACARVPHAQSETCVPHSACCLCGLGTAQGRAMLVVTLGTGSVWTPFHERTEPGLGVGPVPRWVCSATWPALRGTSGPAGPGTLGAPWGCHVGQCPRVSPTDPTGGSRWSTHHLAPVVSN